MQCPKCGGKHIRKNGHRRGKQNYICVTCPKAIVLNVKSNFLSGDRKAP